MALPLPTSLSPSKLTSFTSCGLQFRFSTIDRLPEPPSVAASRGTLVHAALEHLFTLPSSERVAAVGDECVAVAFDRYRDDDEWTGLDLDPDAEAALLDEARSLVQRYFALEDPREVHPVGLELKMEVDVGGIPLRGIIDRLDLVDGDLVVTDYKTGRAPNARSTRTRMLGVHLYSLMCERTFGRRPARIQLLHLSEPVRIVAEPTDQNRAGLERRLAAVWTAVERACETDDFRPQPSFRCDWCAFQEWCPAFGGDPSEAAVALARPARVRAQQTLLDA